jgi:hypothetical protein
MLDKEQVVIQNFYNEARPVCEPLLVFGDILGESGVELQQQRKKVV